MIATIQIHRLPKYIFSRPDWDATDYTKVFEFRFTQDKMTDADVLEWLFDATNNPEWFHEIEEGRVSRKSRFCKAWRDEKLPALSVSDRIVIDGRVYECKPVGWEELDPWEE